MVVFDRICLWHEWIDMVVPTQFETQLDVKIV